MQRLALLICLLVPAGTALAQDNPLSVANHRSYSQFKTWLVRTAEKMPEENYTFKPVEAVRSFGQLIGHVADAQYLFCSSVRGEANPDPKIEQTRTSKADLIASLNAAFAYCDKAYDEMTDASAPQMVTFFGNQMPKLSVLAFNNMHNAEHYGNLVTYMRLKNIVPPSSEPRSQQ